MGALQLQQRGRWSGSGDAAPAPVPLGSLWGFPQGAQAGLLTLGTGFDFHGAEEDFPPSPGPNLSSEQYFIPRSPWFHNV